MKFILNLTRKLLKFIVNVSKKLYWDFLGTFIDISLHSIRKVLKKLIVKAWWEFHYNVLKNSKWNISWIYHKSFIRIYCYRFMELSSRSLENFYWNFFWIYWESFNEISFWYFMKCSLKFHLNFQQSR